MNLKRIILTLCLLFVILPGISLAKEEPIIYTVKEGDTLWDLSQRFIKDPYYWPNLWSNNPDVGNPHLIYPGQKLRIHNGRIEIIPISEEGEDISDIVSEVGAAVVTPKEILLIPTYGGAQSFISKGEIDSIGVLSDTVDSRVMVTVSDKVFLEMEDLTTVTIGDVYEIFSVGEEIRHPLSQDEFGHQLDSSIIGYHTYELGTLEIIDITPHVAVAEITNALREIERGAKIRPYEPIPDTIPRTTAKSVLEGYVISDDIGKVAMGQWEIILIDIGEEDGLQVGNELDLFRERKATEHADKEATLTLPDIDLGDAIVMEVRDGFAEALIIRTTNLPLYRGDRVRTKTN